MKIQEIILNNYRAFCNRVGEENERYKIDLSGGKNLLIYGENGSGKSSLYKALKDFFHSASNQAIPFPANIFSQDYALEEQPFVKVSFDVTTGNVVPFYFSSDFAKINTNTGFLREAGKTKSFMSYRELMKIHFINQKDVNLFEFLVEEDGLLAEIPNPVSSVPETKLTISELWKKVVSDPTDEITLSDFNAGLSQQLDELSGYLNKLLLYFDARIEASFEFKPISKQNAEKNKGFVSLNVVYCNKKIEQYHLFLNEARLTALAISIYLAAHLSVPKGDYEILFLDDVFTGLDTSNRVPLLKILSASTITGNPNDTFLKHQIFLTTYDRQWFDLAKQHLGPNWNSIELFVGELPDTTLRPILIDPAHDYLQKAFMHFENKDYPACANYQRKECERILKKFLPENHKYSHDSDGNIKPISKLGQLFDNLQKYCKDNELDIRVLDEFKNYTKVVLNPLSHDDLESPAYRRELEEVFKVIDNFRKLKNVLKLKAGQILILEKEHGKSKVKYHYEFEIRSDVRLISLGTNSAITKLTVLPIKVIKIGKNGERYSEFGSELLKRISKFLKLSKKPTELDIRSAPLIKMYEIISKVLQLNKTVHDINEEFYIEEKGVKKTLKEIYSLHP